MTKIKFSKEYVKVWGQDKATLINLGTLYAESLPEDLIEYDTKAKDGSYYPLPKKGRLLQLTFIGNKGIPFCTLRRYTPEKQMYYAKLCNKVFDVEIK